MGIAEVAVANEMRRRAIDTVEYPDEIYQNTVARVAADGLPERLRRKSAYRHIIQRARNRPEEGEIIDEDDNDEEVC